MTPRELLAHRHDGGSRTGPAGTCAWCRTSFPCCASKGTLDRQGEGLFDKMNGIGAHEVIIETPRHDETLATMSEAAVEQVLWAFRERVRDLKQDRRFRYIIIFKNHGTAAGCVARSLALAVDRAADRAARSARRSRGREGALRHARSAASSATSSGRRRRMAAG